MPTKIQNKSKGDKPDTRLLILDTTERLMLDEGYGAVSTRRVAKEAGLKPSLIHYYFPTTDDLFLTVFRRAAERDVNKLDEAIEATQSPQEMWEIYCHQNQTALAVEFMALANHRKAIQEEIARLTLVERRRRGEILAKLLQLSTDTEPPVTGIGLNVLLIGVARTLVMERGLGITIGHVEAMELIESLLKQFDHR